MNRSFKNTLGFKAILSVAIPMLAILILVSMVTGVITYQSTNKQLEDSVQNTVVDDLDLIREALWQLDLNAVQSKLDAYVKFGQITGAMISDDNGLSLMAGSLGGDPQAYVVTYDLIYQKVSGPLNLGVLTLEASRKAAWSKAQEQVLTFVMIALFTVIFTIFLINRLLDRLVLTPIKGIAEDLRQRPSNWSKLQINQAKFSETNELNGLVSSIHEMRDQILTSQDLATRGLKRFATAAEIAGLGYATSDLNEDRFLECDDKYAAMHHLSVDEMLKLSIKKDIVELMNHPDDLEKGREVCRQILCGESLEDIARVRVTDGKYRYIKKIFSAKEMPDGRHGVVDIVAQDVTEIFAVREQLLQAQKLEAIGHLTGGVAHDFNNLLAVILGNLELLQEKISNEQENQFIASAIAATMRGADLTKNMLSFARRARLEPKTLDLNDVVRNTKNWSSRALPATINVETSLLAGLWKISCDPTSTESAILNLFLNARDAMLDGGKLTVETANVRIDQEYLETRHEEIMPGRYVMLAISDTGGGIHQENLPEIFEPFFTSKGPGEGSGLGLSMVQGFMKQSGGAVRVYSEVGVGTTFKLYFPAMFDVSESASIDAPTRRLSATQGARILVAEDELDLRNVIVTILESNGYQVVAADSGDAALKIYEKSGPFDLLLTDIVMPGKLQGPKLAIALRELQPSLSAVFMSGYANEATVHGNGLRPEDVRLMKPVSKAKLTEAVQRALNERI